MARIPVALWFHKSNPAAPQVVLIGEGDNVPQALLDAANSALGADAPENNRIAMHESGSGFSDTVGLTDDVGCRG
jgi:hypothetical protein